MALGFTAGDGAVFFAAGRSVSVSSIASMVARFLGGGGRGMAKT